MENEKKVNVKASEIKTENGFPVYEITREKFAGNDGKEYWSYLVRGKARGRDTKVDFIPKDKGGYEPLDIIFEGNSKVELVMREESMSDENGRKSKYMVYTVRTTDEDGTVWKCDVKPARDSDKTLLQMLLNGFKK